MNDKILPEERLLRLIKKEKKHINLFQEQEPFYVFNLNPTFATQDSISVHNKYFSFFSIKNIIFLIFFISCIYLIISFISPFLYKKNIQFFKTTTPQKRINLKLSLESNRKPLEFYLETIKSNNIFGNFLSQENINRAVISRTNIIKDLNLVGIISGEDKQAIIEDRKTQKIYYLNKGQFIEDFQVEEIQDGKIILNNNGERYEIYL